jgi:hypothetical protein
MACEMERQLRKMREVQRVLGDPLIAPIRMIARGGNGS